MIDVDALIRLVEADTVRVKTGSQFWVLDGGSHEAGTRIHLYLFRGTFFPRLETGGFLRSTVPATYAQMRRLIRAAEAQVAAAELKTRVDSQIAMAAAVKNLAGNLPVKKAAS